MERQFHEVAHLFPMMTSDEFAALKQDIAENGLREAIWLHPDGRIIDGRNRYMACTELGIAPTFRTWDGKGSLASFVVSLNLHRRHLTALQRAGVGVEIEPILAAEALEKERVRKTTFPNLEKSLPEPLHAAAQAAAIVGVSRGYVHDMKRYKEDAPEIFDMAKAGEVNGSGARKLEKMEEHTRARVIKVMSARADKDVQKALRVVVEEQLKDYAPPPPTGKYRVIYADPPWAYGNTMPPGTTQPDEYYKLLPTPEICTLPIAAIADDNAVLFLWTTSPHLEESFDVIRAWGFKYKTSFVWDKVKHNMGHYNSVRHEFLLVCVRGSCQPDVAKLFDSVQTIERTEHSVKPEEFRAIIDTIYPFGSRIELFARRKVENWEVWGNEIA